MFSSSDFNQDLSGWNDKVSSVTSMKSMFQGNTVFDQDLSGWDVTSVNDMENMFNGASSFNQDLCAWNSKLDSGAVVANAFTGTNCASTDPPDFALTPPGPFCAVCNTAAPTKSPTSEPTLSPVAA